MSKYSELADRLDAAMEPLHAVVAWEAGSALRELEAENERLREYVQHKKTCATLDIRGHRFECNCGLSAALAKEGK